MAVYRWKFDDGAGEVFTVPVNPNKMGKLKAARAVTTKTTTAVNGQTLFFEGRRPPQSWSFGGEIFNKDHYDALDHWVYDKGRITITDHFLRRLSVVLIDFDAQPKRAVNVYWRHEYTVTGLVYDVDASGAVDPFPVNVGTLGPSQLFIPGQGGSTPAGGGGGSGYAGPQEYQFPSPTTVWVMTHSFDHNPIVETVDAGGNQVFGSVTYPDDTHVRVTFSQPTSGSATLS